MTLHQLARVIRFVLFAAALLAFVILTGCTRKKEIWVYTSIYKEVIAEMDAAAHAAMPDVQIKWFQGGSENVAAKVNTELAAGKPKADLILTSDPFWYFELKKNGKLLPYESPAAREVDAIYRDPEQHFATVRMPVMVMGYNSESLQPGQLPERWKDLADPKWKGKVSMGSPLESGTHFTTVAMLAKLYGWEYFQALRRNELVAAGGNSSVITRIETKERPVGIVLLENILKAQAKGSPVRPIYPADGVIPVPSYVAILKDSGEPELAKKVYDWFYSAAAQTAMIHSGMYSPLPKSASPENARTWAELQPGLMKWSPELLSEFFGQRDQIKGKFSEVVLH